jgi:hypothetical protein
MKQITAFERFAPAILQIYHRDKEAYWAAVMAPFLANQVSFLAWLRNIKVDIGLLSAFKGLDDQAMKLLRDFSAPLGFDMTKWNSNRLKYFKDAYPVFAFLANPYRLENPKDLGAKGANSVTPFMLSLERLGKAPLIDDYWEVFLLFGAAIQMIDDWNDLEGDLANGHYSYVTIRFDNLHQLDDRKKTVQLLREDK